MNEVRSGRSLAKPRPRVRSAHVVRGYAALMRDLACEWCAEDPQLGSVYRVHQIHHVLAGTAKEDADWNLAGVCIIHHLDPVVGFHGANPLWGHKRAFLLKLAQGYELPPQAWAFLLEGRDACPTPSPSQKRNRAVTVARCEALRGAM